MDTANPQAAAIRDLEVVIRVKRMHPLALGTALGTVAGLGLFVTTNWLLIKGGDVIGPNQALLGHYLIGYDVTFAGSLIGGAEAFLLGFFVGGFMASVYNRLADRRSWGRRRRSALRASSGPREAPRAVPRNGRAAADPARPEAGEDLARAGDRR